MSGYGYIDVDREYMERRFQLDQALNRTAKEKITAAYREYQEIFGRGYGGLLETYKTEDADVVIVAMGSFVATSRVAVDMLRQQGKRVGLVKVRTYRPFPGEELVEALAGARAAVVLDRNTVAAVYHDLRSALFGRPKSPAVIGRIVGLGGRDVTYYDIAFIVEEAYGALREGQASAQHAWHFDVIEDEEMLARALARKRR
jgi:pyruvate ferredoxin oxidoreductase alpha subunit